jgi:hypothetical protein
MLKYVIRNYILIISSSFIVSSYERAKNCLLVTYSITPAAELQGRNANDHTMMHE